jgi:hypothetical protein
MYRTGKLEADCELCSVWCGEYKAGQFLCLISTTESQFAASR